MSVLRFHLLGPLEVRRDGVALDLGPRKQRAVLALLLLNANRVVPTERLIDGLWGDAPPETARSALQVYIAGLRKALGSDGSVLRTTAPGYVLELPPRALDLDRFASLCKEARGTADAGRKAELLNGALALWRGEALGDLATEPFGAAAADRLEQLRREAIEERIDADLELGKHAQLIGELNRLVAEHPYHEPFRAQLMLALYRAGRQADALAAYRAARETFMAELGLEPGPALKDLERALLEQDPSLGAPVAPPPAPEEQPPGRGRRWIAAVALAVVIAVAGVLLLRDDEAGISVPPNSLAIIEPDENRVRSFVPVGIRPSPVTVGGGAVWVGNLDDKTLQRVDPNARAVAETIPLGATPTGLAFGSSSVWVAQGLTGKVSRIDPQLGGTIDFAVAQTQLRSTGAITYGSDAAWTVFGDSTFGRIDPRSGRFEWLYAGSRPSAVVEGGGGVWVVSAGDSTVYRFNPATFLEGPIGRASVGLRSTSVAYGFGFVWVGSETDDVVSRVHPATYATLQIPVGDRPVAIASGEGAVWVANAGDGTVSRIDPETSEVIATIDVGQAPSGIAVGHGLVWATVQAP